ncbi:MAG: DNA mismatch repair protein MutS [Clostridia bacterium]|nr:DNA mismatch repair protein MutS [Clostridia bacterium]
MAENLTPMMKQYMEVKEENKDSILFYRIGDFYEMFFDDAIIASRELEITLTGKSCGMEERAPMCGVPFHAAENYIMRLTNKGYKVAICEQVEDPKAAKGLVKREVIRVVTPGTVINVDNLDRTRNNYLMCIAEYEDKTFGISIIDTSTGEFKVTEIKSKTNLDLVSEVAKYNPSEIVCNEMFHNNKEALRMIEERFSRIFVSELNDHAFSEEASKQRLLDHFKVASLEGFGLKGHPYAVCAAGATLLYLHDNQKTALDHILTVTYYNVSDYMLLDVSTRRNLELTETLREKNKKGSLLWVLDKTKTAMGSRLLKKWIEQPLLNKDEIIKRQDAIESFKNNPIGREEIKELLDAVYDFERLMSKLVYGTVNARDLIALKNSIEVLDPIKTVLNDFPSQWQKETLNDFDTLRDIYELIDKAIIDEPPLSVRESGIIKDGYNKNVDEFREAKVNGKKWLSDIEEKEKEKTGIKTLKVMYNKVFGYAIEVSKGQLANVPDYFIRKQTLTTGERYITEELKKIEETILGAEDKLNKLEYDLFNEIRTEILSKIVRVEKVAMQVAEVDVMQSLGEVAEKQNYVKPEITNGNVIDIKDGRHPVVEKITEKDQFIPNDTYLDNEKNELAIITGPNMAGKSTYMRQVAIICLMAQIGSFVPAKKAKIGIVDRIFTRVGASDDLASGQSTFMVEMVEVANILNNATSKSLLILDEIGRGTSTFDGLSIAWAVIEYIEDKIKAKTLFATHYHELSELETKLERVKNYYITTKESGDDIIFLRKIVAGSSEGSFGVQVAKLAGLPKDVTKRAESILNELNKADVVRHAKKIAGGEVDNTSYIKENSEVLNMIDDINLDDVTPIEAMNILYELKQKLN